MKKLSLLSLCLFILFIPLVLGLTYTFTSPENHAGQTSSDVLFNWSFISSGTGTYMPSYLLISMAGNTSDVRTNQTILYCQNNTACNITVSGFHNGYYKWRVVTGDNSTQATLTSDESFPYDTSSQSGSLTSSNTETFNTSDTPGDITSSNSEVFNTSDAPANVRSDNQMNWDTSDTEATVTSHLAEPYNTSTGNNTINVAYTNGTLEESCIVKLSNDQDLSASYVAGRFSAMCNLTVTNNTKITLTTKQGGSDDWIMITGGNGTNIFNWSVGTNYTGETNNTLSISYTYNGAEQSCSPSLEKSTTLNLTTATSNITSACNLTVTNQNDYMYLSTNYTGSDEWIKVTGGNAINIIGFNSSVNYTGETNDTLTLSYTFNSAPESCSVSFTKFDNLTTTTAISNITSACNVTAINESGALRLKTNYSGSTEWIKVTGGNAFNVFGFSSTNTTGTTNNTLDISYTFNSVEEGCSVSFTKTGTLDTVTAISNITNACNLTATNSSGSIKLETNYTTSTDWIKVTGGNAINILGFSTTNVSGVSSNRTLQIEYTVNSSVENCSVTFNSSSAENASDIVTKINAGCNLTATNTTTVTLTTQGYGASEYINITGGTATETIGFSQYAYDFGEQVNITSTDRYFEIYSVTQNTSYFRWLNDTDFLAMKLNKDTGDLHVSGDLNMTYGNITNVHEFHFFNTTKFVPSPYTSAGQEDWLYLVQYDATSPATGSQQAYLQARGIKVSNFMEMSPNTKFMPGYPDTTSYFRYNTTHKMWEFELNDTYQFDMGESNLTSVECITFTSGGKICDSP